MTLNAAIENLYAAFADVPKPPHIEGCPCCINEGEIQFLLHRPLRELTAANLNSYMSSALFTVGTWNDFLYFLPRLLELTVTGEFNWIEPGTILSRIRYGQEHGNQLVEQQHQTIQSLLRAWWTDFLGRDSGRDIYSVDFVLRALLDEGISLSELLSTWAHHPSLNAVDYLADYIQVNLNWLAMGEIPGFRDLDEQHIANEIYLWVTSNIVKEKLEKSFFEDPDRPAAQTISNALLYLEAIS